MQRRAVLYGLGLLVVAVLAGGVLLARMSATARQPAAALTGADVEILAREGVHLVIPDAPPKLTEARAAELARKEAGPWAAQAQSFAIRRVVYVARGSQDGKPAWLATFGGLRMVNAGGARPSAVRRSPSGWLQALLAKLSVRRSYNTQLHILLRDDGTLIFTYSYR